MKTKEVNKGAIGTVFDLIRMKLPMQGYSIKRISTPRDTQHLMPSNYFLYQTWGWSGDEVVLGVPGRPIIWMIVGQGPIALAVGADGGCLDIFTHLTFLSSFSLSLGDGPI